MYGNNLCIKWHNLVIQGFQNLSLIRYAYYIYLTILIHNSLYTVLIFSKLLIICEIGWPGIHRYSNSADNLTGLSTTHVIRLQVIITQWNRFVKLYNIHIHRKTCCFYFKIHIKWCTIFIIIIFWQKKGNKFYYVKRFGSSEDRG